MDRRTFLRAGGLTAGALALPALLPAPASAVPTLGKVLAQGLEVPWGIAFLPTGNALVGERISGHVHLVSRRGGRKRIGRVPGIRADAGEGGLLGLAVARTFAKDRWLYAYISTAHDNRIVRMRYAGQRLGKPHVLLKGIPTADHHNGGQLVFGPDGLLYAGTGDADYPPRAGQRRSLAGKILRLTPDGRVPRGNPFGSYVWTYGHRNVQGLAFDPRGRLWATELGESTTDELNHILRGRNYGWPRYEGGDGPGGKVQDPFVTWSPTNTCSPSGLAIVRGQAFVGALTGHCLWSVRLDGPDKRKKAGYFNEQLGRIRSVAKAPDRTLWITTSNRDGRGVPQTGDDKVIRVDFP